MSHTRNINMVMTSNTIRYCIPIYNEKDNLGSFISAKVIDNEIVVIYKSKNTELLEEPKPFKTFEDKDFVIDFSK